MTKIQDELIDRVLVGLAPLLTMALEEQRPLDADRIAGAIERGTGKLLVNIEVGRAGAMSLEVTAMLPGTERRLLTAVRR